MNQKLRFCVNPKFLPNFPGPFPESDSTVICSFSVWDEGTRGRRQDRFLPWGTSAVKGEEVKFEG